MDCVKVYVDVTAEFSKDGILTPKSFVWKDGRIYEIQRVKDMRRAASLKAGGVGMRYTCVIDGKDSYLFYEDIFQSVVRVFASYRTSGVIKVVCAFSVSEMHVMAALRISDSVI